MLCIAIFPLEDTHWQRKNFFNDVDDEDNKTIMNNTIPQYVNEIITDPL